MAGTEASEQPTAAAAKPGTAAIIGAGGGIGRACVVAFAQAGWTVVAADLDGKAAADAINDCPFPNPGADRAFPLDVTDQPAVEAFASEAGPVDAVIYSAGLNATMAIAETDFAAFRKVMAVNLEGGALIASVFARQMIARRSGGSMVFISSAAGLKGEANASAYCASKFGLIGLVESIAAELTPHDIRVNALAPGNVDTPMLRQVAREIAAIEDRDVETVWQDLATAGAARRLVTPTEVATVCVALCTPAFSAVTGATLPVDGGAALIG